MQARCKNRLFNIVPTAILIILLLVSIGFNIFLYSQAHAMSQSASSLQKQVTSIHKQNDGLSSKIQEGKKELSKIK